MLSGIWASLIQDNRSTGQKSCKESLKREQELVVQTEEPNVEGSVDENTRSIIVRGLKRMRKIGEAE